MTMLRPAILLFILLSLITGGLYPLVTTALGQWWFKDQANGSLIMQNGENRGSRLIGQNFTDARYFQGRPSATAESPYNPMASGGSNLAGSNPELDKAVAERVAALRAAAARQLTVEQVSQLVAEHTQKPLVSFIGMPVVNIVELNLALDALRKN